MYVLVSGNVTDSGYFVKTLINFSEEIRLLLNSICLFSELL